MLKNKQDRLDRIEKLTNELKPSGLKTIDLCTQRLVEKVPVGFAVLDTELHYLAVNQELIDFSNGGTHNKEDLIGKTVREVFPELANKVEPIFDRIKKEGVEEVDIVLETMEIGDRPRKWICTYAPIKDDNQNVVGFSCSVMEDVNGGV